MSGAVPCEEEPTQEHVFWQEIRHMGDPRENKTFLEDCSTWEVPTLEQHVPEELYLMERAQSGAQPVGRTCVGESHEGLCCGRDDMLEAEKCEEREAETASYNLTATSVTSPCSTWRLQESGVKLSLGKRRCRE